MNEVPANMPLVEPCTRKRWGLWLFIPLSIGVITLFIYSLEWRDSLKIQRVVVEGAKLIPVNDILAMTKIQPKSSLKSIDLFDVRNKLIRQPMIKEANVSRQYPNTVAVRIEEREPIALLNGLQIRYVDAEGVVLPYINSSAVVDLPIISNIDGMQNTEVGKVLQQKDLAEAIHILQTAQLVDSAIYHFISEVDMQHGRDVILYSSDVVVQILLGRGDVAKKLVTLQNFWNSFVTTEDISLVKSIDLRFEDQVVVHWNRQPSRTAQRATL